MKSKLLGTRTEKAMVGDVGIERLRFWVWKGFSLVLNGPRLVELLG